MFTTGTTTTYNGLPVLVIGEGNLWENGRQVPAVMVRNLNTGRTATLVGNDLYGLGEPFGTVCQDDTALDFLY